MKRFNRLAGIVAMATLTFCGLSLSACGNDATTPAVLDTPSTEGVIFQGLATDEALVALLSSEVKTDPAQSVVVDSPPDGAMIAKDIAPTVTWHVQGGFARRDSFTAGGIVRVASVIGDWLGPREAWAHGAPVNGRAYYLVFSDPNGAEVVRVFTTDLTYTFDAATWTKLVQVGKPISLRITNAIFENNRVAMDGGPFSGMPVTFSIVP